MDIKDLRQPLREIGIQLIVRNKSGIKRVHIVVDGISLTSSDVNPLFKQKIRDKIIAMERLINGQQVTHNGAPVYGFGSKRSKQCSKTFLKKKGVKYGPR